MTLPSTWVAVLEISNASCFPFWVGSFFFAHLRKKLAESLKWKSSRGIKSWFLNDDCLRFSRCSWMQVHIFEITHMLVWDFQKTQQEKNSWRFSNKEWKHQLYNSEIITHRSSLPLMIPRVRLTKMTHSGGSNIYGRIISKETTNFQTFWICWTLRVGNNSG